MNDASNMLDALRFISDWAKWLITIETGALAVIGAIVNGRRVAHVQSARLWASAAIISFVASIVSAAVLLISLPEIVQNIHPGINIWLTSDSVLGRVFGFDTQTLAILESLFFALGIVCFAGLLLTATWSPAVESTRERGARGR
jgi:hypothetical protein